MNDKDKSENKNEFDSPIEQEADIPVEQDEEIIFPKKEVEKPKSPIKMIRAKFSPVKIVILVALVFGIYFAGYLTSPENFQGTVSQFKEWFNASKEKIAPYQEKLTEAIETKVKKNESEPSTPEMKEGEKSPAKEKSKIKYHSS